MNHNITIFSIPLLILFHPTHGHIKTDDIGALDIWWPKYIFIFLTNLYSLKLMGNIQGICLFNLI